MSESQTDLNAVFRALGDPTRRQMLVLLREAKTLRVSDLALAFEMSLNGVSKHLKVLEKAGIIQRSVSGREHHLTVIWPALDAARDWLDTQRHFWSTRLDALGDTLTDAKKDTADD